MSITPITTPLPGERVIDLGPEDAAAAAATWRKRPNLFPGRALTAPTLEARSRWAAGRVAQRAQAFTAGIVRGLEVGFTVADPVGAETRPAVSLHVGAGQGLTVGGEDVILVRGLQADLWALPVVAPPAILAGGGFGEGGLQPRAIAPALGAVLAEKPDVLPRAAVLVLQPAMVDRADIDPDDPCDRCCGEAGDNVSFEDWRFADVARLLWYAWPEDWRPLPPFDAQLRNRLAFTIFDAERALAPDAVLPWEEFGVPLAAFGLDDRRVPLFADRAAVARRGGRARDPRLALGGSDVPSSAMTTSARLPALWQAQIEQLAEQVAALGDPPLPAAELAQLFDRLPPCGVLPRDVLDVAAHRCDFFPAGFDVDAVPIPVEQLDVAIGDSAGLAPFDLAGSERVHVLVPVSQASYEPRLLLTEEIDPEFEATLHRFLKERSGALAGRQSVRVESAVLLRALRGHAPVVPALGDDPEALEPETLAAWGPAPAMGGHRSAVRAGLHEHGFSGATVTLTSPAGEALYVWVHLDPDNPPRTLMIEWRGSQSQHRAYWGENLVDRGTDGQPTRLGMGDLPETGRWIRLEVPAASLGVQGVALSAMSFVLFDGRAAFGASGRASGPVETPWFDAALPDGAQAGGDEPFEFLTQNQLLAPFEERHGVVLSEHNAAAPDGISSAFAELIANPVLTGLLSASERAQLPARGVEGFIAYLTSRADRADDLVDYGFLKVQTDIYRVRQLVLGTTDASRLTVSPTLASIAKAETAVASQERISTFFGQLRTAKTVGPAGDPGPLDRGPGTLATRAAPAAALSGSVARLFSPAATASLRPVVMGKAVEPVRAEEAVRAQTVLTPIARAALYTPGDVTNAAPLVGNISIRTISVAERLEQPKSQEARDYSTSTRHEAVLGLVRLADELTKEDGEVPGLFDDVDVWGLTGDEFVQPQADPVQSLRRPLKDFVRANTRVTLMAALLKPPVRERTDESTNFSDSADMADRTIALLRQVEGRVKRYREAIAACEAVRAELADDASALGARERVWIERLAEARHDVAVTRALIAEELERLRAINARRAAVLEREVRFVAYMRPRAADNLGPAASRTLDPGLLEAPIPACLEAHADVPDELGALLAVVREAPAAWFGLRVKLLDGLDRVDMLVKAVETAQVRTQIAQLRDLRPLVGTGVIAAIGKVQAVQRQSVALARSASLQVDVARLAALSWQGARAEAAKVVSLGDLVDGEHGQGTVARNAAAFFDRFGRICGCLHAGFSDVVPAIRLDWAELLSQFDEAPNLRNLASLPRWAEIDYVECRRLQGLADWLFDQVDPREASAQALVNDVVRMCLLLASHAPVGRIIAGRMPRPVTARPGLRIPLVAVDPSRLRVGMEALVYRAGAIVTRAVVEDLGQTEASARVTFTAQASVALDESVRVQFAAAPRVTLAAAARVRKGF